MLELVTLMAPPKVTTRKVTLDGGITKFQNEKLTTLEERLFQRWCSGTYTIFFYFCYVCCCCNNSAVDGTPLGLVYGASHQAKINRFKYGCISISSDFLISHQFCYNSKERRRRGCLSPPIILAGGVRFPVKNHSKKSIKNRKI